MKEALRNLAETMFSTITQEGEGSDRISIYIVEKWVRELESIVDRAEEPEQAARERLGRWLVEDSLRRWRPFDNGMTIDLYLADGRVVTGYAVPGDGKQVAINAALDSAEGKKP